MLLELALTANALGHKPNEVISDMRETSARLVDTIKYNLETICELLLRRLLPSVLMDAGDSSFTEPANGMFTYNDRATYMRPPRG